MTPARRDALIATLGGIGRMRPAPGTWGSLAAFAIGAPLVWAAEGCGPIVALALAGCALAIGTPAAERHAARARIDDPSEIVIDEAAGLWIAIAPAAGPLGLAIGLIGFRAFDILKPGPVAWAERLKGGVGIMADDVIAGALAASCVLAHRMWLT